MGNIFMWRLILVIAVALFLSIAYWGWQRYSFLLEPLPETDVSGLSIEDNEEFVEQPINLDFFESPLDSPESPVDLSFEEEVAKQDIDISFLLDKQQPESPEMTAEKSRPANAYSTDAIESVVADFLDVDKSRFAAMKGADGNTICVFDPIGEGGDIYEMLKGFQRVAIEWGVQLNIKSVNSETVVVDQFKAGRCDAVAVTGLKARLFNRFASTIEAVGGLPHYSDLKAVLSYLSSPKVKDSLKQGPYEVAAIFPIGNVYAYVRDEQWVAGGDIKQQFVGKKVGVFDSDKVSLEMIRQLGATPVQVDTTSFAGRFNNGSVDIIFAPSVAYEPMELYRGLGRTGKIISYPLIQLSYQLIIRHEKFPQGFSELLREAAYKGRGFAMEYVHLTEKRIPDEQWYAPAPEESADLQRSLLDAQNKLGESGVYDMQMLRLMRKARCQREPTHYECVES